MKARIVYLTMALVLVFSLAAAIVPVALAPVQASPSWWNTDWEYRQKLTFDNRGQSENLENFPVLVKLGSANIDYGKTRDSGQDIRFVDSNDSTVLSYEIEEWDETGDSWVWINVPQIDGSSSADHIYMYYDNPSAPDGQNPTGVWDTHYKMVQHLKDETTSTTEDSTSNSNDGTKKATNDRNEVDGKKGKGQDFVGTNDEWIRVTNSAELQPDNICLEAWIKFDQSQEDIALVSMLESEAGYGLYQAYREAGWIEWYIVDVTTGTYQEARSSGISIGQWHYIVGTYDGDDVKIFLNGNLETTNSTPSGVIDYKDYTPDLFLGADPSGNSPSSTTLTGFDGQMDEVRISNTARSADWIKAQYLSMTDNFITYGSEESAGEGGDGCFIATAAYGTSTAAEIDVLRAFRDEVLLESTVGSQLVEWYYQTSPPVADFISEHDVLRTLVRELLVEPVAWLVEAVETLWRD